VLMVPQVGSIHGRNLQPHLRQKDRQRTGAVLMAGRADCRKRLCVRVTRLARQRPEQKQLAEKGTAAAPPTATSVASETPIIILDARQVTDVLGKSVRDSRGEDVGRIVDVIVSRGGQMRAAVMDFGGFLGVGSRKVAVGWNVLSFPPDSSADLIGIELTRNQLRLAPEYRPGAPIVVLGANADGATATEDSVPEQ
jgi:hypothetical protein